MKAFLFIYFNINAKSKDLKSFIINTKINIFFIIIIYLLILLSKYVVMSEYLKQFVLFERKKYETRRSVYLIKSVVCNVEVRMTFYSLQ